MSVIAVDACCNLALIDLKPSNHFLLLVEKDRELLVSTKTPSTREGAGFIAAYGAIKSFLFLVKEKDDDGLTWRSHVYIRQYRL